MSYYPPCPNLELTVGNRCHSDKSTLSTLLQDGVGGLSVKVAKDTDGLKKGEWIEVPPINGALVIIVGDILQILSNGRYVSVEHRVRTTKISSRVSIAVFTNPILSEKIGPLPLAVKDDVAFYREVSYLDYLVSTAHTGRRPLDFVENNNPAGF
uniref:Fe2OG dioxygenase domain-containing protein n=1 Tax=Kalanchoe fedtschenkoi TaxID=63787 RepID=A0A7N1A600_KALFE